MSVRVILTGDTLKALEEAWHLKTAGWEISQVLPSRPLMILLEKVAPADRATEAAPTDYTERLALLDTKITDLGWDKRTINCLLNADINTLGDLVKHTKYDLIRIPNLGRKTLAEITETLGYMRLELAR